MVDAHFCKGRRQESEESLLPAIPAVDASTSARSRLRKELGSDLPYRHARTCRYAGLHILVHQLDQIRLLPCTSPLPFLIYFSPNIPSSWILGPFVSFHFALFPVSRSPASQLCSIAPIYEHEEIEFHLSSHLTSSEVGGFSFAHTATYRSNKRFITSRTAFSRPVNDY